MCKSHINHEYIFKLSRTLGSCLFKLKDSFKQVSMAYIKGKVQCSILQDAEVEANLMGLGSWEFKC